MQDNRLAFSLLELLIYMALIAIIMVVIISIFVGVNGGRGRNEVQSEVNSNLRFAVEKIQDDLRAATSVSAPTPAGISSSILQIATASGTVVYCVSSGTLWRAVTSTPNVMAWSAATALPAVRDAQVSVVNNGYVYVMGGIDTSQVQTSTVSYASFACSGDAITDSTVLVNSSVFTRFENTNTTLGKTAVTIQADLVVSYNGTGPDKQYSEEKITTVALRN
jgi:type II secretory pathway pseudopilin PulG